MLYQIQNNQAVAWTGEPINSIRYPLNIESLWNDNELNALGLYRLVPADAPANNTIVVSSSVQVVNGKPKTVHTTRAVGPTDYSLTARQLRLGMIRNNISLSQVQTIINAIPNEQIKDEYQVYWEYSTTVNWSHPITQALIAAIGLDQNSAAAMWMVAKDYEQ